ncbi:MAG: Penicillin-binding protein 1A [Alphaproteobacteria bacterium MarineAlpha3_Bin2]|nr:MAG: Penicillin-binding protein 1A [Alphaproteobacteria bacterium MarineAlpha3_Bin2]
MFRALLTIFGILLVVAIAGAGGVLFIFHNYGRGLPEYRQLADYEPPVMTRVYGGDGRLLAEYATEKRIFVPIKATPKRVIQSFLVAEDKNFYIHPGVDVLSVIRAALTNVRNIGSSNRPVGASTITQQVAKNFLLTNEVSWKRKIKEAILAFRIERALSKDRILELYLNEIYLGFGSYGVAAAALNYFDKSMDELTIDEAAFLAALPKAPNNYHPVKKPKAAKARRDWVIGRLLVGGLITPAEAELAAARPLQVRQRSATEYIRADYFAEEVRRQLDNRYGEEKLYKGGLSVRTTLDPRLQAIADTVLREGLETYDRRHGWRGPVARLPEGTRLDVKIEWRRALAKIPPVKGVGSHLLAVVIGLRPDDALIGFGDGASGRIPLAEMKWARPWMENQKRGPKVTSPANVLVPGDVIVVDPVTANAKGVAYPAGSYGLRQLPDVDGSIVALDPHTGRILAMSGGYSYERSQFNRVTQAMRQPGSAFKPFVYLAALDHGYTPSTLILDAPFVIDQGPGLPKWRPANYTKKFYGPSTMRLGLEKSRNLMTVRLAQTIGMEAISEYAQRFGIVDFLPEKLAMALGSGETTLLRITTAYAMLVNGGKRITPTLIDRIQDRHGETIFRHDRRNCVSCRATIWTRQETPAIADTRKPVTKPGSAYQVVSMLKGVVERGTGRRIRAVGKPLAGKTGTTNADKDTWFIGFSPDLAVGVFVGFDTPKTLGRRETGSSVAAPLFRDFMAAALEKKKAIPFRIPPGIRLVRVNAATGELARAGDKKVIYEAFKPGTVPTGRTEVLEGESWTAERNVWQPATGTGGLY